MNVFFECILLYFIGMLPMSFLFFGYLLDHDLEIYRLTVSKGYTRTMIKFTAIFSVLLLLWPLSLLFITGKYIFDKCFENVKK